MCVEFVKKCVAITCEHDETSFGVQVQHCGQTIPFSCPLRTHEGKHNVQTGGECGSVTGKYFEFTTCWITLESVYVEVCAGFTTFWWRPVMFASCRFGDL